MESIQKLPVNDATKAIQGVAGNSPDYTRYGFLINTDFKYGRFKFGESMGYSKIAQTFMTFLHIRINMGHTTNAIPTLPVYDESAIDGWLYALKYTICKKFALKSGDHPGQPARV